MVFIENLCQTLQVAGIINPHNTAGNHYLLLALHGDGIATLARGLAIDVAGTIAVLEALADNRIALHSLKPLESLVGLYPSIRVMQHHHENNRMHRGSDQRGLTAHPEAARPRWNSQEHARR